MRFGLALTIALLFAVAVPHYTYEPLSLLWPDPAAAAKAWFYVLRGFSGAALFAIVAVLAGMLASCTRSRSWYVLTLIVCLWGFAEETETAVCRLGAGIGNPKLPTLHWQGLCDALAGVPFYWLGIVVFGGVGVLLAMQIREK